MIKTITGTNYNINNEGEVFTSSGDKLQLIQNSNNPNVYRIKMERGWRYVSLAKLMRDYFPYEWIKYLDEGEEVKPISKYNYVTNKGRVWSSWWWKWNKPYLSKNPPGYYWRINYTKKSIDIHTLVGRNFLPEYREGLLILHRDETLSYPEICSVENLWVGTYTDNNRDAVKKQRASGNKNRNNLGQYSKM